MKFQTYKNDNNNRDKELNEELKKRLRPIWLRLVDLFRTNQIEFDDMHYNAIGLLANPESQLY